MRWFLLLLLLGPWAAACSDTPLFPLAEEQGIDGAGLEAAMAWARGTGSVRSVLVERGGVVVAEEYFRGYTADSLHLVWSVTKSFTSTLIGIAVGRGELGGVDEATGPFLIDLVPTLSDEKANITLRHLLTMTSGIPWIEGGLSSEYSEWMASPNQVRYYLDKELAHPPGSYFDYSDGGAHLAGVVLQQAVGMSSLEYARGWLFGPLDIRHSEWDTDRQGFSLGGVGLRVRARDMVKLGRLYLNDGLWEGQRVVPASWVSQATAPQVSWDREDPDPSRGYGYFWWVFDCLGAPCHRASGYGGQLIVVVPHRDLVVTVTSDWTGGRARANENWNTADRLVREHVLPWVHGR